MSARSGTETAGGQRPRLFVFNGGFLTQRRLRRMLRLAGHSLHLGLPGHDDAVAVWGNSPTAHRGLSVAARRQVPVLRVEDAFLRSLHPGRAGEPPIGLNLDWSGPHFDPARPSDLETILARHPLDDSAMMARARDAIARMREIGLTKYSGFDPDAPLPEAPYVLVIDQTRGDASVTASGADLARFREMLVFAQVEHPGMKVVIKTHPETRAGYRPGHFGPEDANDRVSLLSDPVDPWALMEGAVGVYTVSSQMGFEAILAGHRPRVFGQPFYAGWGLSEDEYPLPRRQRRLTRAQLFAAAMMIYPIWYDPYRDALCPLETALDTLEAQVRAWREDRHGWVASGMRLWKRRPLQAVFGTEKPIIFTDDPDKAQALATAGGRRQMAWASKASPASGLVRVEDGFLRSRGLGADLVPPLSLVTDDLGIYYDPGRPSRLERLIEARADLRADQDLRAERLIARITAAALSKYNLGGTCPALPEGHRILVPGQVEDDASILTGTVAGQRGNLDLLRAARAANPDAVLIYKPHPDVEAGLRRGAVEQPEAFADLVARNADPMALLSEVQEVWTLTSLLGFEALLRGLPVTTLGAPFYAGWGLTRDLGPVPARRQARPGLHGLAHAVLIDYPRYFDPRTGLPCPAEVVAERLATGDLPRPRLANRSLAKLQGIFASRAHLWR
ncbi:capsular polysaccharide biosynthesis protein [Pseudodonghicola flavimaris]|uniref:Capsular polysaccharide biosynthesis protein n=1 Tax=Pseudodonghicola flavimaris TaxID=3050036 RepID=A0ABT7F4A9_9RHOB|nr:capsular polysaccharide biosynthesis protein [Pseudodonghicola flavimaris]MDK3019459.1 capsular polysaccharide biosynthesis protein [Pseudodonghicola flavimaris]